MNSAQNQIPNLAAVAASFAPRAERKGWISGNWKWLSSMVLVVGFGVGAGSLGICCHKEF